MSKDAYLRQEPWPHRLFTYCFFPKSRRKDKRVPRNSIEKDNGDDVDKRKLKASS